MVDGETQLSELAVRKKLAELRGKKLMHYATLRRAIREQGFPSHKDRFSGGLIFYWSEIQAWLRGEQVEQTFVPPVKPAEQRSLPPGTARRKRGRPRKNETAPAATEATCRR